MQRRKSEKGIDRLRLATGSLAVAGLVLPVYSLVELFAGRPAPQLPDMGWAILITGLYLVTGLPAAILAILGRARKTAFALSLGCAALTLGAFLALGLAVRYSGL